MNDLISIQSLIFEIRGQRVMLERGRAMLYGVEPKRLNEQVKRNMNRFPPDFMFTLKVPDFQELVAICGRLKALKHTSMIPDNVNRNMHIINLINSSYNQKL